MVDPETYCLTKKVGVCNGCKTTVKEEGVAILEHLMDHVRTMIDKKMFADDKPTSYVIMRFVAYKKYFLYVLFHDTDTLVAVDE